VTAPAGGAAAQSAHSDTWQRPGGGAPVAVPRYIPAEDGPYRCASCRKARRGRCTTCGCYLCGTTARRHNPTDCASPLLCGNCWREPALYDLGEASGRRGLIGARCAERLRENERDGPDEREEQQEVTDMEKTGVVRSGAERAGH